MQVSKCMTLLEILILFAFNFVSENNFSLPFHENI